MKKPSTAPVKSPTARKGMTKPRVYTPMRRNPAPELPAEEAISRTLPRVGPTQGVQAKEKVKPSTRAVTGFMAHLSSRKGSRCSRSMAADWPNRPNWYRPKRITSTPPIRPKSIRFSLKNCPAAVKPKPSRKKAKLMPMTKNRVFSRTLPRL